MNKNLEICERCGCERLDGCEDGGVETGSARWSGCEQSRRVEREIWAAKLSVAGHHIRAWEEIRRVVKAGSKSHFVYARSAELGYTILRTLPSGKVKSVPTSRLHPKKDPKTT